MRCDQTPAWQALQDHAAGFAGFDLRAAFAQDVSRADSLSQTAPHVLADLSKNHVDAATEALLQEITEAIYAAAKGVRFFSPAVVDILIQQSRQMAVGGRPQPQENLSERETEILTLVAEGRSSRDIAEQLHLSHHTINTHRKNILKKLACKSAAELMNYAYSKGLIEKH